MLSKLPDPAPKGDFTVTNNCVAPAGAVTYVVTVEPAPPENAVVPYLSHS